MAAPGDLGRPGVVLVLEVVEGDERAQREEARLGVPDRALHPALRLGVRRAEDDRPRMERAEQPRDVVVETGPGPGARGDDGGVVVEHDGAGHPAEAAEAADEAGPQVRGRPSKGEGDRVRRAEGQRRHQTERLARMAVPDRDLRSGVPPVDLADLAGGVHGALVRPRGEVRRAHLREMLLEDRDATGVTERPEVLADHRRAHGRVLREHRGDRVRERVDPGPRRCPPVPRRLREVEQAVDGVAAHPEPPGDRGLREALAMEEPMDLGPVLHLVHSFLPRHEFPLARGCQSRPSGVLRFRPARSAQYSGGVDKLVIGEPPAGPGTADASSSTLSPCDWPNCVGDRCGVPGCGPWRRTSTDRAVR